MTELGSVTLLITFLSVSQVLPRGINLKSPVFRFLKCQIRVLRCCKLQILRYSVPWTKQYDKAIINCKNMATGAGLIQMDSFVLLVCFVFMGFFISVFWNFLHQKSCYLEILWIPNSMIFFSSIFSIVENWGLSINHHENGLS